MHVQVPSPFYALPPKRRGLPREDSAFFPFDVGKATPSRMMKGYESSWRTNRQRGFRGFLRLYGWRHGAQESSCARLNPMCKAVWVLTICALGCSAKNPYVGSWDSEVTLMGNRIPLVCSFGQDGTYTATFEIAGAKAKLTGSYVQEKGRLSIVVSKLDLDTKGSFLPQSMIDEGRKAIEKEMKEPLSGAVTWVTDSTFTVKPDRTSVAKLSFTKRAP